MPEVSVIVVTFESRDELECLRPLRDSDFRDFEVVLRDDEGISRARNEGIREAAADKLVFLDDDAIPCDGWLETVSTLLEEHDVVAGRVEDPRDHFFSKMGNNRGYDQGDDPGEAETLVGCNMAFRRDVFETVGTFDENIDFGHEETLFAERVREEYEIHYSPDLVVEHEFGNTPVSWWKKQLQYGPADVYRAKKLDEPVFTDWYELVPVSGGSSLSEVVVKTAGKTLRNVSRVNAMIRGVPTPQTESRGE
ncbi:glycosyltransferase family 2 protein [Halosimplex salinum]|uniref:glycosyltransferase family 2 protein n=1 Tax=Halosimplex salinum TaxID=1710538 RepID=UPI0013DDD4FB|nr:glycosyltransferase [Halosimplex salinum]